jgi:tetratricopeptide (TPR) repeat protein
MKKKLLIILWVPFVNFGQNYKSDFDSKFNQKDYNATEIQGILNNWKKVSTKDIDYFIAAFNFYFKESQNEIVQLSQDAPHEGKEALVLSDSLGNKAGYMFSNMSTNDSLFKVSQNTIDTAIQLFPNRLDLRFGKIHTLGAVEKFDEFTTEILETIAYSYTINHKWLWSNDTNLENPENFFIDAMQSYQNTLFQVESDENLKKITKKMYEIFPNDLFVISSYGVTFLIEGKNKEALELYLKAEKINPNDTIVLNNIGLIYERLSDKNNALKYYKKITAIGNEKEKLNAQKKINNLN